MGRGVIAEWRKVKEVETSLACAEHGDQRTQRSTGYVLPTAWCLPEGRLSWLELRGCASWVTTRDFSHPETAGAGEQRVACV